MKLKNILTLAAAGMLLAACDDVAPEDRLIPEDLPDAEKRVLVFDFTGQNCSNCPYGARALTAVMEKFPGKVFTIAMSPKGVFYTIVPSYLDAGITSQIARDYYDYYNPKAFPAAVVDGGALNYTTTSWGTDVISAFDTPTPVDLEIAATYDEATRQLTVDYTANFTDLCNEQLAVAVWVVESGIEGYQDSAADGGKVYDYVHNHILRACLTDMWGDALTTEHASAPFYMPFQVCTGTATGTLDADWVPENCAVVAAVATPSKTFIQAAECHVVNHETEEE